MRAVRVRGWDAAPVVEEVPEPRRAPGRAVVRLLAAGVNPVDLAIAGGRFYGPVPDPPFVAGAEAVGEVVESDWLPVGTRVWCLTTTGAFAELFSADEDALVPVPAGIDDARAAAIGIAGLAGWMGVVDRGGLRPAETVLVLGAGGVVGQVAVQAARLRGADTVVAAARSGEARERALALGAHRSVALDEAGEIARDLAQACAPGADLVIDMLWGAPLQAALGAARPRARFVQVGSAAGATAMVPGGALRGGRFDIRGFSVFAERPRDLARSYRDLADAVACGTLSISVEALPLTEAPIALARVAGGAAGRKLVLVP